MAQLLGRFGFPDVEGISFTPGGTLFGADLGSSTLITINPATGAGTAIGLTGFCCITGLAPSTEQDCVQPPTGLVSWWPGDGDADDIVGTNDGTLQGGAGFAPGMVGQAFSFDGSDDFVRVPHSPSLNPSGSFSIDAWIFPTQDEEGGIVVKWADTGVWASQRAYTFSTQPGLALRFGISDDAHQLDAFFHQFDTPANVITLNAWNHVAAVYDQLSGTRRIYVNGALVAERTDPPITVTDSIADLTIGGALVSPVLFVSLFTGLIDEVENLRPSAFRCGNPDYLRRWQCG